MDLLEQYSNKICYSKDEFKAHSLKELKPGDKVILIKVPHNFTRMICPGVHEVVSIEKYDSNIPLVKENCMLKLLLNERDNHHPSIKTFNVLFKDVLLQP